MDKKYYWVENTLENMIEIILTGDPLSFQFREKDYFIEGEMFDVEELGRVGSYYIANPNVQEDGTFGEMTEYSESGQYKVASQLLAAPCFEGKTIIERFSELKFFD